MNLSVRKDLGIKEENKEKISELPQDISLAEIKDMTNMHTSIVLKKDEPTKNINDSTDLVHYDLNSLRTNRKKSSIKQILEMKVKL